jgi:hypothetical protein
MKQTRAEKKAEKLADDRIDRAYRTRCSNIPIDIMDIPKVFAEGRKAIAGGADDQALGDTIAAFVETIRKN